MANNPNISRIPDPAHRLMPSRTALTPSGGVPAGECLNNWMPAELTEQALCYVLSQQCLYRFDKTSVAAPNGSSIIATMAGTGVPGRWVSMSGVAGTQISRAISYDGLSVEPTSSDWLPFIGGTGLAVNIDGSSPTALTFVAPRHILSGVTAIVKVKWFLSYTEPGLSHWIFAAMLNGATGTPLAPCADHIVQPISRETSVSVATGSTIVALAPGDTIELMAQPQGAPEEIPLTIVHATLKVYTLA
jgi:hypothetical protein